uniref:Ribosomal protein L2 n=1 Tax=Proschkinia sp. SZCZR1824 TaxID=2588390 RepID=A0A4Y5SFW2_9STRA|nr:ribosomal protein L2 [Proschkinia sp. SZCZR1824]
MIIKIKNFSTLSLQHSTKLDKNNLAKNPLLKTKIQKLSRSFGKNNSGKITVSHKGGGQKRRYRNIDFNRLTNSVGIITTIEYDPNRSSFIASVYEIENNSFVYILAPKNLKIGDIVKSGLKAEPKIGHCLPIINIPVGSYIHNVSISINKPAQISRSAGTFSKLVENTLKQAKIELSSGEKRFLSPYCYATIGTVSNEFSFSEILGKAGRSRWLNIRPTVRGVAMNPVDHPHGGGEGKKSGKNKTPWGKNNKKGKTSTSTNKLIIK